MGRPGRVWSLLHQAVCQSPGVTDGGRQHAMSKVHATAPLPPSVWLPGLALSEAASQSGNLSDSGPFPPLPALCCNRVTRLSLIRSLTINRFYKKAFLPGHTRNLSALRAVGLLSTGATIQGWAMPSQGLIHDCWSQWFPLPGPHSSSVGVWLHPRTWNSKCILSFLFFSIHLSIYFGCPRS